MLHVTLGHIGYY
jgi:hypothetical protein